MLYQRAISYLGEVIWRIVMIVMIGLIKLDLYKATLVSTIIPFFCMQVIVANSLG